MKSLAEMPPYGELLPPLIAGALGKCQDGLPPDRTKGREKDSNCVGPEKLSNMGCAMATHPFYRETCEIFRNSNMAFRVNI